jgi:hypothetical protein
MRFVAPNAETGCWEWVGAIQTNGYGQFQLGNTKTARAHRMAWQLFRGEIPQDYVICHRCDVRHCVNPDHLFPGTQLENIRDAMVKGTIKPYSGNGWKTRLPWSVKTDMYRRYTQGDMSSQAIADLFGVSRTKVSRSLAEVRNKYLDK